MIKQTHNPLARFPLASVESRKRIIARSGGEAGSGKTTFWLGAPGPIFIQSFDRGLEGVVEEFSATKEIRVQEYDWAPARAANSTLEQDQAIALREQFTSDFEFAIEHFRTVVWDKETDVWNLFKFAEFGPAEKGTPQNWDALKQRIRRLLNMPKALNINFGVIQGMKNEWVPQTNRNTGNKGIVQSGRRICAGMDDVDALVHITLIHRREKGIFYLDVDKSRGPGGKDVQDQTFEGITFTELAMLIFPQSTPEDWR